MCRKDRFGLNRFRLIKRLTEVVEMPPRYSQAAFSFSAVVSRAQTGTRTSVLFSIFDCHSFRMAALLLS